MGRLPTISGKDFLRLLQKNGFEVVRVKGSHHRMKHRDGRVTTVLVHKNDDLPKGLLHKIIREDLKITLEEFETLIAE
ncbi:type II toxin-antitoxin system HicA family toxin [Salmonirosea aquatica]|uniref:Addiction module toxin, HicA family n=1 Tax=Salmonirosea aquatica TaxID=2654236 RepID=A0A7C9BJT9_9BACT|nr:addiction module toxin, HicA family [Cytophagaceae bacterium SJW1-29]